MNRNSFIFTGLLFLLFSSLSAMGMCHYKAQAPFFKAVREGDFDVVVRCVKEGMSVNERDFRGLTPLHIAAEKGHVDLVVLLAYVGADLNARGVRGLRPIHKAVSAGKSDIIEFLVGAGAKVDCTDNAGKTALHYVVELNNGQEVAVALVRQGADILRSNKVGRTPFGAVFDDNFKQKLSKEWRVARGYEELGKRSYAQAPKMPEKRPRSLDQADAEATVPSEAGE